MTPTNTPAGKEAKCALHAAMRAPSGHPNVTEWAEQQIQSAIDSATANLRRELEELRLCLELACDEMEARDLATTEFRAALKQTELP